MKPLDVIPRDEAAEAGALSCVVSAPDGEAVRMLDQLQEEYLNIPHSEIFRALLSLQLDDRPLNCVELVQRLKEQGKLDDAGGLDNVSRLPDVAPSPANFPSYLEAIKKQAKRREKLREGKELQRQALDPTFPVTISDDGELLHARRFNPAIIPATLNAVYTLAGISISTPGNLTTITSAVKTGKSAVVGAAVSSAMPHSGDVDLLGFNSSNPKGLALLWFDSEQSPDDSWHCVNRSITRAGLQKPPAWLYAYCLTGFGYKRGWRAVLEVIRQAAERHGGIHSIMLDGAADFIADVNDAAESNAFVATLHDIAIQHHCPIVGVIHFNPGSDKSRGHLGSQLERKAETNLALEKDSDETTVIYSTKNRRAGIPKHLGPRFAFNTDVGMHVTVASRQSAKDAERREVLLSLAQDAFGEHPAMRYSDMKSTVQTVTHCKERGAEKKIAEMIRLTVIKRVAAGMYEICTPA